MQTKSYTYTIGGKERVIIRKYETKPKKVTAEVEGTIEEMRKAGKSLSEIMNQTHLSNATIHSVLRKRGLLKFTRTLTKGELEKIQKIKDSAATGKRASVISRELGIPYSFVYRHIK